MKRYEAVTRNEEVLCERDVENFRHEHELSGRKVRYAVPDAPKGLEDTGVNYTYGGVTCGEPATVKVNGRLICSKCYSETRAGEHEPSLALIREWKTVVINNSGIWEKG